MSSIALVLVWVSAAAAALPCLYLLVLTLLSGTARPPAGSTRSLRFDVFIPAHNEAACIAAAARSTLALDWPADRFRVFVIADNCTDATRDVAAAAGARVLVRTNDTLRGKGHALDYAFTASRTEAWADAVVVIDADSRVSPNLLEAMAARMERGEKAVQVHYGVSNADASWRTRLMAIALGSFHRVRSRARERLGVSCGIRGNGWGLTGALLDEVPYRSYSLAEDLEFGIELGLRRIRVAYADEASCDGEMVTGGANARSQRQRWEKGRLTMLREKTLPLLRQAVAGPNLICFDLAMDLLVLPLSYVALLAAVATAIAAVAVQFAGAPTSVLFPGVVCLASVVAYVLRGWQLSGTGARGLVDLCRAPFFLAWKVFVLARGWRSNAWVRTKREIE